MKVGCQVAVVGDILMNNQGKWIVGFAINLCSYFALVAEVYGAWHALQITWARGCTKVIWSEIVRWPFNELKKALNLSMLLIDW